MTKMEINMTLNGIIQIKHQNGIQIKVKKGVVNGESCKSISGRR